VKGWLAMTRQTLLVSILTIVVAVPSSFAQNQSTVPSDQAQAEALQKAVQNPVASLVSVPLQNNANFAYGPYNRTQNVLNIRPVTPIRLSEDWNLVARIIQPLIWQPYFNENTGGEYGRGDTNPSFFLSPAKPGKLI
jgi:hypothetical protein